MRILGQIGDRTLGPLLGGFGLRAIQVAGISAQKHACPRLGKWCKVHKDLAQSLCIDLSVFQSLVQAGPGPLKERRERPFGEAACSCFAAERIHQVEQGIFRVAKAPLHPVTKVIQCVKVHQRFVSCGYITLPRNPLTRIVEVILV